MEVYSKGSTPKLNRPGENYYCEGATSYKAAEISGVESSVNEALNSLKAEIEQNVPNFDKLIEDLDDQFGAKFIQLNDQKLGFVDVEAFNTLSKGLTTSMEKSESNTKAFFATCTNEINNINSWLSELESNAAKYNDAARRYHAETTGLFQNEAKAAAAKAEMDKYKKLPNDPMSYGDWIKG